MLAAAILPLLIARLLPPAREAGESALKAPFFHDVAAWHDQGGAVVRRRRFLVALLAWLCLVLAAARPQWIGETVSLRITGRDLMLAVDLSGSMNRQDLKLGDAWHTRIDVVKRVAGEFIEKRHGDRIGLILFATRAYLQAPLTFDRPTVRTLLDESFIGLAGEQTAIGDAIGLAIKRLRDRPAENRVLVLLTDGANTAGSVDPLDAARVAAKEGLKIYTIGVGADVAMMHRIYGTTRINPSADLDEPTLAAIARITGGRYFRARDTGELAEIYRLLDELEPVIGDDARFRPTEELFHWPLALALALAVMLAVGNVAALVPAALGARVRARDARTRAHG